MVECSDLLEADATRLDMFMYVAVQKSQKSSYMSRIVVEPLSSLLRKPTVGNLFITPCSPAGSRDGRIQSIRQEKGMDHLGVYREVGPQVWDDSLWSLPVKRDACDCSTVK